MGAPVSDKHQAPTLLQAAAPAPPQSRSRSPAPPKGGAKTQASPFRGKYPEGGMGAPVLDKRQAPTLLQATGTAPPQSRSCSPAPPKGGAKTEASPFRGKYPGGGMGAPVSDKHQAPTL